MYNTFKLCNMRDCLNGDFPKCPHSALNTCKVFFHEETGMWYDEMTGQVITAHDLGDGRTFDVQAWLHVQMTNAMKDWRWDNKVHEKYSRHLLKMKPQGRERPIPKYTNEELDGIADNFVRSRRDIKEIIDEIKVLGDEIGGYERMLRKWRGNAMIRERINRLKEERNTLRQVQSGLDQESHVAKIYLKNENAYNRRWMKPRGKWNDFILTYQDTSGKVWVIDRNGLNVDGVYVYLPYKDASYIQSALYASKTKHIPTNAWKKVVVPADNIGSTLRRFGKKNSNGRRIQARAEQHRYATQVMDFIKFLKNAKVDVRQFGKDDNLLKYYDEEVVPKLTRR